MTKREPAGDWRTYRCPVCSHTDAVSLTEAESGLIRCSHCNTPLTVGRTHSESADVTVADGRGPGTHGEAS